MFLSYVKPANAGKVTDKAALSADAIFASAVDWQPDEYDTADRVGGDVQIISVAEPLPGIPGVSWQRTKVLWPCKAQAPWVHHEQSADPIPADEANPSLVRQADAILAAAQRDTVVGRKRDANVARTASGRKSRSRRAVLTNEQALQLIRHARGDLLDVMHIAGLLSAAQCVIGQALHRDIREAERNAMVLIHPPRASEGDLRTYTGSGGMKRADCHGSEGEADTAMAADEVPGSTGMPEIRELDTSPARRRLDDAFRAIQARLQGGAAGWAMVTEPQKPGPRWRILDGATAIRQPHPGHAWPGSGRPMLPLTPTARWVRREPAPSEATRQTWRWLCDAVTATANGNRYVLRREVEWLRQWLDELGPIYAPAVSGQEPQKTRTVAVVERMGTKCTPSSERRANPSLLPAAGASVVPAREFF